ncbi:hypothetical protein QQF64_001095 [Cirrhinus molitorella]|uniref:Uncharacterized protein n=2 Tax=Cirrhinus molitorella TaxID=172907 RepID=A0AA88Q5W8_9TELE|nr:hypothetical protein Q8A67_004742 [Cirrhinus molitorella]
MSTTLWKFSQREVSSARSQATTPQTSDLTDMQCVAIRGSPVLLGDDPTEFLKACFASDDGDLYQHVPVGILSRENKDVALQPLSSTV